MNITRNANKVTIDVSLDVNVIGFAKVDDSGVPKEYVMLQGTNDTDDEWDSYGVYIERDDQGFCGYDGIVRCVLYQDRLLLDLDEQIGKALGDGDIWSCITILFDIDDNTLARLRCALMTLFAECNSCFSDRS